jgi:hypothetical protein
MPTFALAKLQPIQTSNLKSPPNLTIPDDHSQGEEGRKLRQIFIDIVRQWREYSPRGLNLDLTLDRESDLTQPLANQAAIELLQAWREGDAQEQEETWEYLKEALEKDRLSNRRLFT